MALVKKNIPWSLASNIIFTHEACRPTVHAVSFLFCIPERIPYRRFSEMIIFRIFLGKNQVKQEYFQFVLQQVRGGEEGVLHFQKKPK